MGFRAGVSAALAVGLGAALPALGAAPPGWTIAGNAPADYQFAVDTTTAESGKQSASITAKPGAKPGEFGMLMQTIAADDYRGGRVQLSGSLRTAGAAQAQLWMRVVGPQGKVLQFDDMAGHAVTGTTGWKRYDITVDVPRDSVDIAFGVLLIDTGKVWADDLKLEKVGGAGASAGPGVPLEPGTSAATMLRLVPANMDFEEVGASQSAVWIKRSLRIVFPDPHFDLPYGFGSCDVLYDYVRSLLRQLGARRSDLDVKEYQCLGQAAGVYQSGIDATFWVLAPADEAGKPAANAVLDARWRTVKISLEYVPRGDIFTGSRVNRLDPLTWQHVLVQLLQQKILPLFPTRSVAFQGGTSVSVRVLEPARGGAG